MKKLVIFDFDGTLMDTNSIIVESLNEAVYASIKRYLTDDELQAILGRPIVEQMEMVSKVHRDEMVEFYRQYYRLNQEGRVFPFEGIKELLETLKTKGIKCAILTNKGRNGLNKSLMEHELEAYFEYSLTTNDIEKTKPDPYGIYDICKRLNVDLNDAIMVGDSAHDIEAGKRAGIETVLVGWTIIQKETLLALEPDYIINHPMDLLYCLM